MPQEAKPSENCARCGHATHSPEAACKEMMGDNIVCKCPASAIEESKKL